VTGTSEIHSAADALEQVREQAAHWDVRIRSPTCTTQERAEFEQWLQLRPEHAETFAALQQGIQVLQLAAASHPRLRAMRDRAAALRRRAIIIRWGGCVAGIAACAFIGVALIQMHGHPDAPPQFASVFHTAVGERSSVQLQDGSEISLDTNSRVDIVYSKQERALEIAGGRAYFRVAKDASRPFIVTVADREVVAVGTEFDIRLDEEHVFVTLIEGQVDIRATEQARDISTVQELVPGERLVVNRASGMATIARTDLAKIVSWRQGKVLFESTPLSEAVAEMNRYLAAPIVIDDPALAQLHVNGMFYTAQPENFIKALIQYFGIKTRIADGATHLSLDRPIH